MITPAKDNPDIIPAITELVNRGVDFEYYAGRDDAPHSLAFTAPSGPFRFVWADFPPSDADTIARYFPEEAEAA